MLTRFATGSCVNGVYPVAGSTPRCTEKAKISRIASMKDGIDSRPNAPPDSTRSSVESALAAQRIPSGTPTTSAPSCASSMSSTDTGSRLAIACRTISPVRCDWPKSPTTTPESQCR
jgi:hypothetical protein